MLTKITNFFTAVVTFCKDLFTNLFGYDGILVGSTLLVVTSVAVYGLTPITLTACIVTPALAGLYNFYFNSGIGQFS